MATGILDLPDEVLLDVAERLSQHEWSALCKTCSRLQRVAEPLLYRSIHMRWDETSYDPPIALLLRSILENPNLSPHVRSLKLSGQYYKGNNSVARPTSLTITTSLPEKELLVASNSIGASAEMQNELRLGNPDGFIALLMARLHNLEYLYLDVNWVSGTRFLGSLLKASLRRRAGEPTTIEKGPESDMPSFKALRKVFLITNEYEGSQSKPWTRDTRDGLRLFYLPNIEHLTIAIANPISFSWPFINAPNPSHLSSLEIYRVRECYLESVLSVLDNLQKLRYVWNYQPDIEGDVSKKIVELDTMAAAIVQKKDTLTHLEIIAHTRPAFAWGDHMDPKIRMQGSLVALSQLSKLRKLTLPWTFLAGLTAAPTIGIIGAVLPTQVEDLDLHLGPGSMDEDFFYAWENEDYFSFFKDELKSGAMDHCKCLSEVTLPGYCTRAGLTPEEKADLETIGHKFGFTLRQGGSYADVNPHRLGQDI